MNDKRSMSEEERIKLIYDLKSLIQKATEVFWDNTLLDSLNEIKCLFDMGYAEEYIKNPDFDGLADAYKCFNSKNKKPMTVEEIILHLRGYPGNLPIFMVTRNDPVRSVHFHGFGEDALILSSCDHPGFTDNQVEKLSKFVLEVMEND